jgi:hypothetical protein
MAKRASSEPTIIVRPDPNSAATFDVAVRDSGSESHHQVTVPAADAARWAELGADPATGVEAAMRFLLDREPKESILAAFDIDVIRRYFPKFDEALPAYLSPLSGEAGNRA